MPSRALFFSPAVYRKNLTRYFPLWLAYLCAWLVILPLSLLSNRGNAYYDAFDLLQEVFRAASAYGTLLCSLYAILVAMALHGWYYRSASATALGALPVRREAWFGTNLATALTVSLVPHLIVALCTWAAAAAMGRPGFSAAATWFAAISLQFLFFYALAALCAAVTGQLLALPVLYGLVNFTAVVVNYVVMVILSTFVYGLENGLDYTALSPLSPVFHLVSHGASRTDLDAVTNEIVSVTFAQWPYLLGLGAAALVLLLLAFLSFRVRRMEAAGDVIALRPLRPVFKYVFSAGCALVLGSLIAFIVSSGSNKPTLAVMILSLLAGGFVGFFTAEVLLKKTFRVFGRSWIGFGVFSACLLLAVGVMELDLTGYERRVPAVGQVESLAVSIPGGGVTLTDPAQIADFIALHQSIVAEKGPQEALERQTRGGGVESAWLQLNYRLRDGGELVRSYLLYSDQALWDEAGSLPHRLTDLVNEPALLLQFCTPDFPVAGPEQIVSCVAETEAASTAVPSTREALSELRLGQEEAYALYIQCILPDLQEGKLVKWQLYRFGAEETDSYACNVQFSFIPQLPQPLPEDGPQAVKTDYQNYRPIPGSRTARFLEERGMLLVTCKELEEAG